MDLTLFRSACCINTMRKGSPSYSIVIAFEDAFRTWEGKLIPHHSEWRPINTSSMSLRPAAEGHTFQSTIHSPSWTQDLLRIPHSFWEGASHQTSRGGWWMRALSEELTSKCASANKFGQPTSWPRTDAPVARRAHVKGRLRPRRKRGPKPSSSRHWAS